MDKSEIEDNNLSRDNITKITVKGEQDNKEDQFECKEI